MKELINKISSYNLFNYLFPGVLFVVLLSALTNYNLIQENLLEGVFLYYFFGLLINRVGSLVIQPIAKYFKFIVFKPYPEFIKASKEDTKLEVLSETNNMFRSIAGLFLVLLIIVLSEVLGLEIDFTKVVVKIVTVFLMLILLLFSFRKQTKTIYHRIEADLSKEKN
jgi:hypothetical protein